MKKNVLIFPAGTEIANEMVDSLKNNKLFNLFGASSIHPSHADFNFDQVYNLPNVDDEAFLNKLNNLCNRLSIDMILCAHDDVCYELSKLVQIIDADVVTHGSGVNSIVRFKDKTYDFFKDLIPVPEYTRDFPMYVKPKRGAGDRNSAKIDNEIEWYGFFDSPDEDDYVQLEYLSGDEYTIDCFSRDGDLEFCGARIRSKTVNGISALSSEVSNGEFINYATKISSILSMNGSWFFQMKRDSEGILKLLEIAPRIGGSSSLYRIKGINFTELDLYNTMGKDVEILYNDVEVTLSKHLNPIYKTKIQFDNLYVDFDDTLFLDEKYINTDVISLIFECKNHNKKIHLLTKHEGDLNKLLDNWGISRIFDSIVKIDKNDRKINYVEDNSILIDDSFSERKEFLDNNKYAFSLDNIKLLIGNIS
tara:strand:- start:270 stop:1529 length:1260 start_codon:yes stop_codon:yes gene_type:complete